LKIKGGILRLDYQGRVVIPRMLRQRLNEVIVFYEDNRLFVLSIDAFLDLFEKRTKELTGEDIRLVRRMMFSQATQESIDKQGRVSVIPKIRNLFQNTRSNDQEAVIVL